MSRNELDKLLRISGMAKWQLAAALGVSEPTLYRWLRTGLSDEQKTRALRAVREFIREDDDGED